MERNTRELSMARARLWGIGSMGVCICQNLPNYTCDLYRLLDMIRLQ